MWFSRDSRTGARRPLTAAVAAVAAAGGLLLASPALGRGPSGDPSLDVRSSALFVDGAADRAAGLPGDDLHPEHAGVETLSALEVGDEQHRVVEANR